MSVLGYLEQVQRGIDYLEEHLDQSVDLTTVSKAAGISHWHFQRIFKALTGETLMAYVRSRRLANAHQRLLTTDEPILRIALEAGYESQAAFTRAFRAAYGTTPGAFRRLGDKRLFPQKVRFDADYLQHLHTNMQIEPRWITRPAAYYVGMKTTCFGTDSDKNNVGEMLPPLWDAFLARLDEVSESVPGVCYGIVRTQSSESDQLEYFAAIEATTEQVPEGMTSIAIEPAEYACFEHRGPAKQVDHTVSYIYSTWLMQSGYRHTFGPDLEIYDDRFDATSPMSVFEYAVPVARTS